MATWSQPSATQPVPDATPRAGTTAEEDDVSRAEQVIDLEEERRKRAAATGAAPSCDDDDTRDEFIPADDDEARAWLDGLMRSHGERLARYFHVRLRDEDMARDLVIETFYQAWKSRHTFRGEARASTWLWTIGRRTLAAHYKRKKRREGEVLTEELPERGQPASQGADEAHSRRTALMECLGKLNARIQRTAELVWLLGHSYVDAAEILEDSADSVRMRLKRARPLLQECLAEQGILGAS